MFVVTGLSAQNSYIIRVSSGNELGNGTHSPELTVVTPEATLPEESLCRYPETGHENDIKASDLAR